MFPSYRNQSVDLHSTDLTAQNIKFSIQYLLSKCEHVLHGKLSDEFHSSNPNKKNGEHYQNLLVSNLERRNLEPSRTSTI